MDARQRLESLARSLDGIGAASDRARYLRLVAPGEPPGVADAMMRMSGCALVVRGLWREAGIRHSLLDSRYRVGMAVSDIMQIAHESSAIRSQDTTPQPGDVVLVGGREEGPEHVYTVLRVIAQDWPAPQSTWLEALDGGQRDEAGAQICRVREHEIMGDPPRDGARPVRRVVDFDAVWRRFGRAMSTQNLILHR